MTIDVDMMFPQGLATTKGTPQPVIDQLRKALHSAIAAPAVDKRLRDMGAAPLPTSPAETSKLVERQVKLWKEIVSAAGISRE